MIRNAASSSIRPSLVKCSLRTSQRGLPVRLSYTSSGFNRSLIGNWTLLTTRSVVERDAVAAVDRAELAPVELLASAAIGSLADDEDAIGS